MYSERCFYNEEGGGLISGTLRYTNENTLLDVSEIPQIIFIILKANFAITIQQNNTEILIIIIIISWEVSWTCLLY